MVDLFFDLVQLLFEALAGVLYPPKDAAWRRWQRFAMLLGAIGVTAFGTAVAVAWFTDGSAIVILAVLIGVCGSIGFAIMGCVCFSAHTRK